MSNRGEIAVRGKWLWVTYSFCLPKSDTLQSNLVVRLQVIRVALSYLDSWWERKKYVQPLSIGFCICGLSYFRFLLPYSCICPYLLNLFHPSHNWLEVAIQVMAGKGEKEENALLIKAENWNWKMNLSYHYLYNRPWKVLGPDELRTAEWSEIIWKQKSHVSASQTPTDKGEASAFRCFLGLWGKEGTDYSNCTWTWNLQINMCRW